MLLLWSRLKGLAAVLFSRRFTLPIRLGLLTIDPSFAIVTGSRVVIFTGQNAISPFRRFFLQMDFLQVTRLVVVDVSSPFYGILVS